jgi:hypothetical protein
MLDGHVMNSVMSTSASIPSKLASNVCQRGSRDAIRCKRGFSCKFDLTKFLLGTKVSGFWVSLSALQCRAELIPGVINRDIEWTILTYMQCCSLALSTVVLVLFLTLPTLNTRKKECSQHKNRTTTPPHMEQEKQQKDSNCLIDSPTGNRTPVSRACRQ